MRRLVLLAALGSLLLPGMAHAAPKAAVFGLRAVGNPKLGYFVYPLAPGATKQGAVIVSNVGTAPGTVKLFTADGTTGPTSGAVYKTDVRPTGTGSWVSLSATSLSLAPGAHREVRFTVHVPRSARPGQWVAGIVAETGQRVAEQKPGQKARVQIKIRDLTIVAVQVNVPGPLRTGFTIGNVTTGGSRGFQKVFVHLVNTGNVLVKPNGSITIYDKRGAVVETLPFTLDTFVPQTAIDYPVLLKKALGPGDYSALVRLTVPGVAGAAGRTVSARPRFSISNTDVKQVFTSAQPTQTAPGITGSSSSTGVARWIYFVAAAVAAALLLAAAAFLAVRRRRRGAPGQETTTLQRPADEVTAPPPPPSSPPPAGPEPEPNSEPQAAPTASDCDHDWDVAYDQGRLGDDGLWRFPHRCRTCGRELLARDVADASEQAQN